MGKSGILNNKGTKERSCYDQKMCSGNLVGLVPSPGDGWVSRVNRRVGNPEGRLLKIREFPNKTAKFRFRFPFTSLYAKNV